MASINDEIEAVRSAQDAAQKLRGTEARLRGQHGRLLKEREKEYYALRSIDEVVASMKELVDGAASKWAKESGKSITASFSGAWEESASGKTELMRLSPRLPRIGGEHVDFRFLCGAMPELMKSRLEVVIRTSGAEFGLPAASRAEKVAEIDRQIASIETMHTQLVDAAAAVQIVLSCLPTVQARRDAEGRQQEIERERAAARAAGLSADR